MRAAHEMQIFHLKQCNEVEDGRVNITFHAARDAREVFVNVFSQTIKATVSFGGSAEV